LSQLAAEHKYRNRKEMTAVDQPTSLNLFDEDVYNAMDDKGHIVRKDMFKGKYVRAALYCLNLCSIEVLSVVKGMQNLMAFKIGMNIWCRFSTVVLCG
jgi:hypothetical protein